MPVVLVPAERIERWTTNFAARHGEVALAVTDGALVGVAVDGARFSARLPFDVPYAGEPEPGTLRAAVVRPAAWGVLLVRKGGFAVARLEDAATTASKVGRRHVQGRTKAGGQSQQRFARRRDNQARAAFDAAADHAVAVLRGGTDVRTPLPVVLGGDRAAVADVLTDARLRFVAPTGEWADVPDPRRDVLEGVVERASHIVVDVDNG